MDGSPPCNAWMAVHSATHGWQSTVQRMDGSPPCNATTGRRCSPHAGTQEASYLVIDGLELQRRRCGLDPQAVAVPVQDKLLRLLGHLLTSSSQRHRHQMVVEHLLNDLGTEIVQRGLNGRIHTNCVDVLERGVQELLPCCLWHLHGQLHRSASCQCMAPPRSATQVCFVSMHLTYRAAHVCSLSQISLAVLRMPWTTLESKP